MGHDCKQGTCAFLVRPEGGEPEQLCQSYAARGFSPDGSVVLMEKYAPPGEGWARITAFDLAIKSEKDFLRDGEHSVYQAYFSWDNRRVVFERQFIGTSQIMIAPVRNGVPGRQKQRITITDGRYVEDKPQFSRDGRSVYFLSSRDGHNCIWNQKLNPITKYPGWASSALRASAQPVLRLFPPKADGAQCCEKQNRDQHTGGRQRLWIKQIE